MEPLLGTILLTAFPFAPPGWMICDGRLLSIREYTALYALLGPQFGGDGKTTFALPDLRGRIPVSPNATAAADRLITAPVNDQGVPTRAAVNGDLLGSNVRLSSTGATTVALTVASMPPHTHTASASSTGATVEAGLTVSVDGGQTTTPMNGGYLAATVPSAGSDSAIYRAALDAAGSVMLAKASGQATVTPVITNSITGTGVPLAAPTTITATAAPVPPFLAMQYLIAVLGDFPARN